jgi:Damage-control phosphatase ARMT1-like domain
VVKGDANYRRLLGDRVTPISFPFCEAMSYWPAEVHLIALRTCKAPLAVGITDEGLKLAEASGCVDWRNEGKCGVLQYNH